MVVEDPSSKLEDSGSGTIVPGNRGSVDVVVEVDIVVGIGSIIRRSDVAVDGNADRMAGTGAAFVSDMVKEGMGVPLLTGGRRVAVGACACARVVADVCAAPSPCNSIVADVFGACCVCESTTGASLV